jgi:hypothetical protein
MVERSLSLDEWQVLVRLERWIADIAALRQMLGDRALVTGVDAERARAMFGAIKHGLRDECDAGARLRGYEQISEVERRWYQPTIRMAYSALQSKLNTTPGGRWAGELGQAAAVIVAAIENLKADAHTA